MFFFCWFWGVGERERERKERRCERETLIGCLPDRGSNPPTTCVCALTGNWISKLLVHGMMLQPTEPPGQGRAFVYLMYHFGIFLLIYSFIFALTCLFLIVFYLSIIRESLELGISNQNNQESDTRQCITWSWWHKAKYFTGRTVSTFLLCP